MASKIFYSDEYKKIESNILKTLNDHDDYLSLRSADSPRAVGDAIETILEEEFPQILGSLCKEYQKDFARRSMADLAFIDIDDNYYCVDICTHRNDTKFNMPNVTSVERLARLYQGDNDYFVVLSIAYDVEGTKITVSNVHFAPIEFYMWDCLTIGALGWGQIQIANSNNIHIQQYSRKKWMLEFCDIMLSFYPKEITKINSRIIHFQGVKEFWLAKPDELI